MKDPEHYIKVETAISIMVNAGLSLFFFLLMFRVGEPAAVWGRGQFAFDFLPQSFMIALMSTLVPGILTARRRKIGKVAGLEKNRSRLPSSLWLRAAFLAVSAALAGGALAAALLALSGLESVEWRLALVIKMAYGALLAAVITPIGLRPALL